jgi:hypothetical protein
MAEPDSPPYIPAYRDQFPKVFHGSAALVRALGGRVAAAVLVNFIHHHGQFTQDRWVTISAAKLADWIGLTDRSVRALRAKLVGQGLIEVQQVPGCKSRYRVSVERLAAISAEQLPSYVPPSRTPQPRPKESHVRVDVDVSPVHALADHDRFNFPEI